MKRSRALSLRLASLAGLLSGLALCSSQAHAEEADAASIGAARALAIDGIKLADGGDCQGASVKLSQAEALYHSQVVASRLGECEIQLGRIVEGTERLRRLLREPVPENATPAVTNALAKAKQLLEEWSGKVANLQLTITGPKAEDTTVKINGAVVPAAGLGVAFPVNPGAADIEVTAEGYYAQTEHVTLGSGEKLELAVALRPEPKKAEPSSLARTEQATARHPARSRDAERPAAIPREHAEPSYAPAYVSFIVGAVGLGVGAYYGMDAKKDYDALAPKCQNNVCPLDEGDNLASARNKGTIATVGLGVGAGAVVLGTILLIAAGGEDEPPQTASGLQPWVGGNEVGVWGTF